MIGYLRSMPEAGDGWSEALRSYGCRIIYRDTNKQQSELEKCLAALRQGDELVVPSLSSLGRTLSRVVNVVNLLADKGVLLTILEHGDTVVESGGNLLVACKILAVCEKALLRERNQKGPTTGRARGRLGGRKRKLSETDVQEIVKELLDPKITVGDIAQKYGVSRTTLYKYIGSPSPGSDE